MDISDLKADGAFCLMMQALLDDTVDDVFKSIVITRHFERLIAAGCPAEQAIKEAKTIANTLIMTVGKHARGGSDETQAFGY